MFVTKYDLHIKQKISFRTIAGLMYDDHTELFCKKLEILPLTCHIEFFNLQFI